MAANPEPAWQFANAADQRLSYLRTDKDKPPVVLVHGFTDGSVVWQSLIRDLVADYDVIAYDSRGHGGSSRVSAPYSFVDLADELEALVGVLGLKTPVGLIGHSMGATVAAMLAARRPDLVAWLILEDPYFREEPMRREFLAQWRAATAQAQTLSQAALADLYRAQHYPTWREEDIQTRAQARLMIDLAIFDHMDWWSGPSWYETCAALHCKGLLLCGDVDKGAVVTPQAAQTVSNLWRGVRVVYVSGVGHHIRCGHPIRYAEAIGAFLADLEGIP
ncbi:MAG: alpha/beta hydrolase [Anaerolineae bacterium]|nr:alpha/beta hydrolase [Anaerolineae bacterium]MDW8173789.1 alpha/beta hydrolase [Anaerolineae bacterium]